jgi:lipopolysaccharide transport system ATP-binding protein
MDEVLSVGDARFQQRSLRKLRMLVERGATVVLVSHNLSTIGLFCQEALCLNGGKIAARGDATAVVSAYVNHVSTLEAEEKADAAHGGTDPVVFQWVRLFNRRQEETHVFRFHDSLRLQIQYRCENAIPCPAFTLTIRGAEGRIFQASMLLDGKRPRCIEGAGTVECLFPDLPLAPGWYHVVGSVRGADGLSYAMHPQVVARFSVEGEPNAYGWENPGATAFLAEAAPVVIPYEWRFTAPLEVRG